MSWEGKRVLVTGADGFIGSHLVERLSALGAEVRALVLYNSFDRRGWLDDAGPEARFEAMPGDVRDPDLMKAAVRDVEIVFHLAALIGIPYSYAAPLSYLKTNVEGTAHLLRASVEADVERFVHTSTSEVYGTARYVPIDEKHPLQGQSPYSASKIGADKVAESFACSFGLPVVTVRPFNTYGPRQSARAVIPTVIAQCLEGDRVRLGNTTPTRDLNYVSDTVAGFLAAATAPAAVGATINLGSGREISIGDLARLIGRLMDREIVIESEAARLRPDESEVERLLSDNRLARELLGWEPRVGLEQGLERTIEWVRAHAGTLRTDAYVV